MNATQPAQFAVDYPDRALNRLISAFRIFVAIPHLIVLVVLSAAALVVVVVSWFAILFTGRYPRRLFDFVEGVGRWNNRVVAYAIILITDRFPPSQLRP